MFALAERPIVMGIVADSARGSYRGPAPLEILHDPEPRVAGHGLATMARRALTSARRPLEWVPCQTYLGPTGFDMVGLT